MKGKNTSAGDDVFVKGKNTSAGDDVFVKEKNTSAGDDVFVKGKNTSAGDGVFVKEKNTSAGDDVLERKPLTGGDVIVETLIEQGTEVVFGYPGGAVLNTYDSLYRYKDEIRHVLTSHEQHGGHSADGYARATGKVGVVIATSGPGSTNLVTALATAKMDSVPVVALTGNVDVGLLGIDSFQEVDTTGITRPITKHNFLVTDVRRLKSTIESAFRIASTGRKGPVLIDIPKNVTGPLPEDYSPLPSDFLYTENIPCRNTLAKAEKLIRAAERPLIYAGGGVTSAGAEAELALFARLIDAPVCSSLMGQGAYDQSEPNYLGMLGMHGTVAAGEAMLNCDLLIAMGTRFSDRVTGDLTAFCAYAKIIHIDIDVAEHGKNVPAELEVAGDLKEILRELNRTIPRRDNPGWLSDCEKMGGKAEHVLRQTGTEDFPVTPQYIIGKLSELTNGEAIVTTEVGQNQMWAAMYYTFRKPRSFLTSGGLGTMGFGLGAAIGAKVGCPDRTVINIAGDGSFGMNIGEMITLRKHNIPVMQFVLNNSVLGMVRQWQKLFYENRFSETVLDNDIDYLKLGEAFGVRAFVIQDMDSAEAILREAFTVLKTAPVLIDCRIDRDLNVLPMTPPGKDITNPILIIDD
ncbi:acetolactate synthase [Clostridia bacterium]|nr:acetolactate synthase [Clostridia bacterium]